MLRYLWIAIASAGLLAAANAKVGEAKAKLKDGKYDDAIAILDAESKAKPKDAEVKKALADAHFEYGNWYMNHPQLPPFRKYPAALREFRTTVSLDPANSKAKENVATIEGIYRSMGREVPK
jgi:tetratricopeptide (TPR) repeat protein